MDKPRLIGAVTYAGSPFILMVLTLIYAVSPDFYLHFVLSSAWREGQLVESITALFAFASSVILFRSVFLLWAADSADPVKRTGITRFLRSGAFPVLLAAVAITVLCGEEVNWGQNLFLFDLPDYLRPAEFNLHNRSDATVLLGEAFLFGFFLIFPVLWRYRRELSLPADWIWSVPEKSVSVSLLVAYGWQYTKFLYLALSPSPDPVSDGLYVDFFHQLNEHKELLVAFSFLMYGFFRLDLIRSVRSA